MKNLRIGGSCVLVFSLHFCRSGGLFYPGLPEHYQKSGLISSSTYQVTFSVLADSEEEARSRGETEGRIRAFEMMVKEPFIGRFNYDRKRNELQRLVSSYGRVVYVARESPGSFGVVYQVTQQGNLKKTLLDL
ncbi:MAG: hypothetical protein HS115_14850 [Spirochaetales bacterium]|nr:hypothetical protein [Spirochaetales bacterium]